MKTFIDLFAGMGGTRIGFELACESLNVKHSCVFSSEIKKHAVDAYKENFKEEKVEGDITEIDPNSLPHFDYLLAGFPCQPFSSAGTRKGFLDKRGGLFFSILDILKTRKPEGFMLENVEGLVNHDSGRTFGVMLDSLREIGYKVNNKVLDSSDFGVPQKRVRVYIVGHRIKDIDLEGFHKTQITAGRFIDNDMPFKHTKFTKMLTDRFPAEFLIGKAIKDKRGGSDNIHSWDLEYKGSVTQKQKELMSLILKKRRYKKWAKNKGIEWMDGMPLTLSEISTFYKDKNLGSMLKDLEEKGYLKFEHPKQKITADGISKRVPFEEAEKGYNIVAGKLSYPIAKILHPEGLVPTLVATEAGKIGVVTNKGVRPISVREGLRFSGFPDEYNLDDIPYSKAFDLIGNTVMPPVIKSVVKRLILKAP